MIAIADTNIFIKRILDPLEYKEIYTTSSVLKEIKDADTREYYEFNSFNITIKDPSTFYIAKVNLINEKKNLKLSEADIDVVALTLELSEQKFNVWISKDDDKVVCLSQDNGIRQALSILNLSDKIREKKWKFRCYGCFSIFDEEIVFCKHCGYDTISRVSVYKIDGELKVNFKKNFVYKNKTIKDKKGLIIKSEDQKEFIDLKKSKARKKKNVENVIKNFV